MVAGLVTAKKHSHRLPGKNTLSFCGLPLFLWSVIQSECSHLIDKTYVSTDGEEIARLGAHVPRQKRLAAASNPPRDPLAQADPRRLGAGTVPAGASSRLED